MINKVSQTVPYQFDTIYSPFKATEFEKALEWLADNGFSGVELAIAYPDAVNAAKLFASIKARSLTATTISTGQIYGFEGICLSSIENDVRKRAIKTVKGHVDLSCEIGMPNVTIGLLRGKSKSISEGGSGSGGNGSSGGSGGNGS
ncbi:MAG: sugar phosphate isomerase/epimerase, partial [Oscillospiraceae bacterium]|nr:sugar phosphate isomerase/epimerase [Oscillospiraceae bacterium]